MKLPVGITTLHLSRKSVSLLVCAAALVAAGGYSYAQQGQAVDDAVTVEATVDSAQLERMDSRRSIDYESEVVAYDRYLGRPQWSASYDGVRNVSVERGLFGSPLWLDAGTVFFDRNDGSEDGESIPKPRSSIAFVPDPERAGELFGSQS